MLYIFNNLTLLSKKRQRKALNKFQNKEELIDLKLPEPLKLLQKEARIPVYKNYDFKFFKDINLKHNDLLLEIKNAKKYILLEYFISQVSLNVIVSFALAFITSPSVISEYSRPSIGYVKLHSYSPLRSSETLHDNISVRNPAPLRV